MTRTFPLPISFIFLHKFYITFSKDVTFGIVKNFRINENSWTRNLRVLLDKIEFFINRHDSVVQ